MAKKLDVVRVSLQNAATWQAKKQPVWVSLCLGTAIKNLLAIAVEQETRDHAISWLQKNNVRELLLEFRRNLEVLVSGAEGGTLPASSIGGNYPFLVFAHVSWTLEDYELAGYFVDVSCREDVMAISTPFWREYATAASALVHSKPYTRRSIKLRGQERYWSVYLDVMAAAKSSGHVNRDLMDAMTAAFDQRMHDSKITDDNDETEGSATHKVAWDYRRDGLLRCMQYLGVVLDTQR